ncbi:protein FAR1-RELATED SEQUENCE 5 [Arachis duranensis]|uniref:Protein FAR1-RELATED SEQUENCE 5 n=1 Tax=Arachis duranensis TaxID=130453 RepID=A0A6P5MAV6_ARADU|nr:protein FAR1-RELATED SEQUENCE 5 [Arachis duranensis]
MFGGARNWWNSKVNREIQKERKKNEKEKKSMKTKMKIKKKMKKIVRSGLEGEGRREWEELGFRDSERDRDVLAFDATYKKNRYRLLVVIFSGVNHHNQTVVFGFVIVSNERKSTYVWLLKQLLIAMKGKTLISVITDGHPSMTIAIQEVFPNAHHRLRAWHLMRNATRNIHKPQFTKMFTKLMLGDYEVGVFEQKWEEMVRCFRVEDREWIVDKYGEKNMWTIAHIRGKFFVGFRMTSRCEILHVVLKRYVKSRHN